MVLVLPGSVETHLVWSGKFYQRVCRVFLPVSTGAKNAGVIVENKVAPFYGSRCIYIGYTLSVV